LNERRKAWADRRAKEVKILRVPTKLSGSANVAINPSKANAAARKYAPKITGGGNDDEPEII
jgi:hypothetical protein